MKQASGDYTFRPTIVRIMVFTGTAEATEHWGRGEGGYEVVLPLNIFKIKFPFILISFVMTIHGKYKTS